MSNTDKLTKQARRCFKGHVAEFHEMVVNGNKLWLLNWVKPDSNHLAVKYTYSNGILSVTGCFGESMYYWGNYNHLQAVANFQPYYFIGKRIGGSFKNYEYDSTKAEKEIKRIFIDNQWLKGEMSREEAKELCDEIVSIFSEYNDPELCETIAYAKTELENISDWHEYGFRNAGKTPHRWLWFQYIGLVMAVEQLKKRGILKDIVND